MTGAAFLLAAALARGAALELPESDPKAFDEAAAAVVRAFKPESPMSFKLAQGPAAPRDEGRRWKVEGLRAALAAGAAPDGQTPAEGRWISRPDPPRILLIENSSTVSPMSTRLRAWNLPFQSVTFEQVEASPKAHLDAEAWDAAVFSSPGWWGEFANPPSGPSRLPKAVAEALRAFVSQGSGALFLDIAQWDLEKAWPKTLSLAPLGPYQLSSMEALGWEGRGKLALAQFGVAADKILKNGAVIIQHPAFEFPDGRKAPVLAAYALPDPDGGMGIVAGMGFHPFEQDDSLAGRARRLLFNFFFASGSSRISASGDAPLPATPTPEPSPEPTAQPTQTPSQVATEIPTPVPSDTPQPTPEPPTATPLPTARPTHRPTLHPTAPPTRIPTPLPRPVLPTLLPTPAPPRSQPTPRPTLKATAGPTPLPTPFPTAIPRAVPTGLPTAVPRPSPRPTVPPPPTPRPKPSLLPSPRPSPAPAPATPLAMPTIAGGEVRDGLGCLQSSPEPFGEGGVYVFYCLKTAATVQLKVFDETGKELWSGDKVEKQAGTHQLFYDGLDPKGRMLRPGRYLYRLDAWYLAPARGAQTRQSAFNVRKRKPR